MTGTKSSELQAAFERAKHLRAARKHAGSARLVAEAAATRLAADTETRSLEPGLLDTVWPEYGYLSAYQRTELFTKAYVAAYRQKYAQYRSCTNTDELKPINDDFTRNLPTVMTALWHARQHADRLGVRYEFFIRNAMEEAIQNWRKTRQLPRPNQLWRGEMLAAVLRKWNLECETRSCMPRADWDKRFLAVHFQGDLAQMATLDVIERDVLGAWPNRRHSRLSNYLFDQKMITEAEARRRFGDDLVEESNRESDALLSPKHLPSSAYLAPCLGLVDAQDAQGCRGCPWAEPCRKVVALAQHDLRNRFGSENPKRDKVRRDTNERVRRHRQRKRDQENTLQSCQPQRDSPG